LYSIFNVEDGTMTMFRNVGHKSVIRHNIPDELRNKCYTFTSISKHYQHLRTEKKIIFPPLWQTTFHSRHSVLPYSATLIYCLRRCVKTPYYTIFRFTTTFDSGPGSVAGIATGYGLDCPGIKSRWGRDFPCLSKPALGPIQPPVQWVPRLSRG
jgi:hypothetical protein